MFRLITNSPVEEQIYNRAQEKLGIDNVVIQAGRFNKMTTDEERKTLLQDVIRSGYSKSDTSSPHTWEEINRMLARSDDEFQLFQEMDRERRTNARRAFEANGGLGSLSRLLEFDELNESLKELSRTVELESSSLPENADDALNVEYSENGRRRRATRGEKSDAERIFIEKLSDKQFDRLLEEGMDLLDESLDGKTEKDLDSEADNKNEDYVQDEDQSFGSSSQEDESLMSRTTVTSHLEGCSQCLEAMLRIGGSVSCLGVLPDPESLPAYYSVIANPISLSEIQDKLSDSSYDSQEFVRDVRRFFTNASAWEHYCSDSSESFRASLRELKNLWKTESRSLSGSKLKRKSSLESLENKHSKKRKKK